MGPNICMIISKCPLKNIKHLLILSKTSECKSTLGTYNFDQEVMRRELAMMIILYEYPISMAEHNGF